MKFSLLLVSAISIATSVRASLDFTPGTAERKLDGIVFKQLVFHKDGLAVTYEAPRKWQYSGDARSLRLTPDVALAQATIEQESVPAPLTFDDEALKKLQDRVVAALPQGATNVTVVTAAKNPFMINSHETVEVVVSYIAFGREFGASVIFINTPDTVLRCRCIALKADFEKLNGQFRGSLFSFQNL